MTCICRHVLELKLLLIVGEGFVGIGQRTLLDLGVLIGGDEIPVDVFHLTDGGNHLSPEGEVSELKVLLGNLDEALVGGKPEALQ